MSMKRPKQHNSSSIISCREIPSGRTVLLVTEYIDALGNVIIIFFFFFFNTITFIAGCKVIGRILLQCDVLVSVNLSLRFRQSITHR